MADRDGMTHPNKTTTAAMFSKTMMITIPRTKSKQTKSSMMSNMMKSIRTNLLSSLQMHPKKPTTMMIHHHF